MEEDLQNALLDFHATSINRTKPSGNESQPQREKERVGQEHQLRFCPSCVFFLDKGNPPKPGVGASLLGLW